MNLPKIDISALPDLDTITGMFGSLARATLEAPGSDDTTIVMMVFVYEVLSGH